MIQFNLLPDVKVQYIKAKKAKRMVIGISLLAVAVSVTLLALTISATLFQKKHISDLDKDIKKYENSLKNTPDLNKILTIQNQLTSLPALYAGRPVTSRIFGYMQATTPAKISLTKMSVDFANTTLSVDGTADTLESVNRYVDTLKFTTYTLKDSEDKTNAFSQVVLSSFNRDAKQATYSVDLTFDPALFDGTKEVTLNVPQTITTRSETELPGGVFDAEGTN
jgi:hypothetical protein